MRKKSLKPDKNGAIWVNIGIKPTRSGGRSQGKICLGQILKEAERRLNRIEELWEHIERTTADPVWDEFTFEMAKRFGNGEIQIPIPMLADEDDYGYATRINVISRRFPFVKFAAEEFEEYEDGVRNLEDFVQSVTEGAAESVGLDARRASRPSDATLHKAMDAYVDWIKREYFDADEGHVSDNGITKVRQVKTLKDNLRDIPISDLDFSTCDEMFGRFRKRPISARTKEPMKRKSCQNYIGELGRFFDWLDLTDQFSWRLPERFRRIRRKVDELDSDIAHEAAEVFTFSDEQISLLYRYAGPLERLFILLALNCAFGVDQTGRIRVNEVHLERNPPIIKRIRRKKKVLGKHYLWRPTCVLLKWALDRRVECASDASDEFLILKQSGKPFWRKTNGGNRARDIPNYWNRLISRVQDDHPKFPKVGFNSLRDTSVHRIREIAGEEIASIHATHKHHSPDENLRRYSNAPWKRVYQAQRNLERRLSRVLSTVSDPTVVPKQAYVSLGKRDRIAELHHEGRSVASIAKEVGVSKMTVYRTIESVDQSAASTTSG